MNKVKHPVRHEIDKAKKVLSLNDKEFREVDKIKWKNILNNIENEFINKTNYKVDLHWGWNYLKGEVYSLTFLNQNAVEYLNLLVNNKETVWFLAEERSERIKFWIYEGNINGIQKILDETYGFEYYIVSKKYEWLLCEDHHCILHGTGRDLVTKMKKINLQN